MTKDEFLEALGRGLRQLPEEERERQLSYYAELLLDMQEDGIGEAEALGKLGDPAAIAAEILRDQPLPVLVRSRVRAGRRWTPLAIVLAVLGSPIWLSLGLAFAAVVLSLYLVIWSLILVAFTVVLSLGVGGIALLCGAVLLLVRAMAAEGLMLAGGFLVLSGLTIAAFYGAMAAARGLIALTTLLARGVKSLFIRKED